MRRADNWRASASRPAAGAWPEPDAGLKPAPTKGFQGMPAVMRSCSAVQADAFAKFVKRQTG